MFWRTAVVTVADTSRTNARRFTEKLWAEHMQAVADWTAKYMINTVAPVVGLQGMHSFTFTDDDIVSLLLRSKHSPVIMTQQTEVALLQRLNMIAAPSHLVGAALEDAARSFLFQSNQNPNIVDLSLLSRSIVAHAEWAKQGLTVRHDADVKAYLVSWPVEIKPAVVVVEEKAVVETVAEIAVKNVVEEESVKPVVVVVESTGANAVADATVSAEPTTETVSEL